MTLEAEFELLCESLAAAEESLGEIECQHRSEVALYGDSWPGALLQIEDCRRLVLDLKRKIAHVEARLGKIRDCATDYDIPY